MKMIVGLGNPGEQYAKNRHNVGFVVVDALLDRIKNQESRIKNEIPDSRFQIHAKLYADVARVGDILLVKPQTFMNASGQAVSKIKNFYKIDDEDIYLVHDDLDIRLGEYKIGLGIGPKVHNGIESVEKELGTKDFFRVRIGIDNRGDNRVPGDEYVLSNFTKEEREVLDKTIENCLIDLITLISK